MNDAIHVDGVGFGYNETRVLDGLTLHIPGGATTAVVGANGSGKSTLLGLLAGTLFPQQFHRCAEGRRSGVRGPTQSGQRCLAHHRRGNRDDGPMACARAVAASVPGGPRDRRLLDHRTGPR